MTISSVESPVMLQGADEVAAHRSPEPDFVPHVCVCICTYKRPQMLKRLLEDLASQEISGELTHSIVVVDNDSQRSGERVVKEFAEKSTIPIQYDVEPQQNISLARNRVVANTYGDYLALIDDDEFPRKDWLLTLVRSCERFGVDGVLGPVLRHFDEQPPQWVIKGNFYDHPTGATGTVVKWPMARTGNVLLRRKILEGVAQPFRPQFRGSEDQDFFRRMIEKGHNFVWCNEAVAYEVVPPARWNRKQMLRKALLRGSMARLQPTCGPRDIVKSAIAVPSYLAALPVAFFIGHHRVMDFSIRLCDHLGKLLAVAGFNPIKEPYVVDPVVHHPQL
jgi:succinoglycan biosynthesis protein ExoM